MGKERNRWRNRRRSVWWIWIEAQCVCVWWVKVIDPGRIASLILFIPSLFCFCLPLSRFASPTGRQPASHPSRRGANSLATTHSLRHGPKNVAPHDRGGYRTPSQTSTGTDESRISRGCITSCNPDAWSVTGREFISRVKPRSIWCWRD